MHAEIETGLGRQNVICYSAFTGVPARRDEAAQAVLASSQAEPQYDNEMVDLMFGFDLGQVCTISQALKTVFSHKFDWCTLINLQFTPRTDC